MEVLFNLYVYASLLSWNTLALLQEVVTPVAQVEHGKYGWENYSRDDIDFLCPGWELVEPGLGDVQYGHQRLFHVSLYTNQITININKNIVLVFS